MSPVLGIIASSTQQGRGGGPVGAYDSLASFTVPSGGISSITFSGIPQTYTHLQVRTIARSTRTGSTGYDQALVRFNGDSGTNYSSHYLEANGSSVIAGGSASISSIWGAVNMPWAGYTANVFGGGVMDILDYRSSKYKTAKTLSGFDANGSGFYTLWSGTWLNTSAITSLTLVAQSNLFTEYSTFALYGVK